MSNRYDIIENASPRSKKRRLKKLQKKIKKLLTNRKQRDIVNDVAADEATTKRTLKI